MLQIALICLVWRIVSLLHHHSFMMLLVKLFLKLEELRLELRVSLKSLLCVYRR
jgi:hypothetical protein